MPKVVLSVSVCALMASPARKTSDPDAEAWIMLAGGFLGMVGRRVGLLQKLLSRFFIHQ